MPVAARQGKARARTVPTTAHRPRAFLPQLLISPVFRSFFPFVIEQKIFLLICGSPRQNTAGTISAHGFAQESGK
jgi:hypothetical protein